MIQIDHLNRHQIDLLNIMWSINSLDDLMSWKYTLSEADQQLADTLIQLITIAYIDEDVLQCDFGLANEALLPYLSD